MAEVVNEMYQVLKHLKSDMAAVKDILREINARLNSQQSHLISLSQDVHNIYAILARHDARLERIERRLDLVKAT